MRRVSGFHVHIYVYRIVELHDRRTSAGVYAKGNKITSCFTSLRSPRAGPAASLRGEESQRTIRAYLQMTVEVVCGLSRSPLRQANWAQERTAEDIFPAVEST